MVNIDLSHNVLSGRIQDSRGKLPKMILSKMILIAISQNKLTRHILHSFGKLSNLHFIALSQNKLTRSIPAKVLNLKSLEYFDVSDNHLRGRIPPQTLNISVSGFSGNLGLSDAPLPPCKHEFVI